MSSSIPSRLASLLKKARASDTITAGSSSAEEPGPVEYVKLTNPVENYYRHKAKRSIPFFYRFALQTRSLAIRDCFAKIASTHSLDLQDLMAVIEYETTSGLTNNVKHALAEVFDCDSLLALADLLANTARDNWDTRYAVLIYDFVREIFGDEPFSDQNRLQYVEALYEVERYEQAARLAEAFSINETAPCQVELLNLQRIRKTNDTPDEWLQALNQLYADLGMSPVRLLKDESVSLMDRLAVEATDREEGPRITVIMPTFSPGSGIHTAIRSLLEQSWQNLEIIVVDDASPLEFQDLFNEIEQLDSRVRVLHQQENAGAYVARNTGLAAATGEFITTHDDDDWSHPNKLAMQVNEMLEDPGVVATTSAHIRTSDELEFRRLNIRAQFLQMNYSSLMFRRSVVDEIGPWDSVNRGGDSEFLLRLLEYFGKQNVVHLSSQPLSFSRVWIGSLTSGEMSRGYFAYSRLLYRWAFRQWHWSANKADRKAIRNVDVARPYAIPTTFEAGERNKDLGLFDVIYVTDYFRQAKYVSHALHEIETLSVSGLRVGYMHLYSPETTIPAGIPPRLFELQQVGRVTQVSHDDRAETKLLIVNDPATGMFLDQLKSTIRSRRSIVIDHKLATLSGGEPRTPTILSQALRNLDDFFDTRFEITGATAEDYDRVEKLVPGQRLLPQSFTWHTHIRSEPSEISVPMGKPVAGFHSYGNQYRWPNNAEAFKQIYVSSNYTTRLFGHLEQPIEKFDLESFEQIDLFDSEGTDEAAFLNGIDFWMYSPHYRLEDRVWGPVLGAMQAGKVVILPHRLEPIYGDAAAYAEPHDVPEMVSHFANDPDAYLAQALRGQRLIAKRYTASHLVERLQRLLAH